MACDVNKKQLNFSKICIKQENPWYLENKNMLRTFLDLKLKKLRTSEAFLQFWCSYKKNVYTIRHIYKLRYIYAQNNVVTTPFKVLTLFQRPYNVALTSYASWVGDRICTYCFITLRRLNNTVESPINRMLEKLYDNYVLGDFYF